ncbi:pyocin knob domain-containing protein [Agathobaculum sp. NTUH-O15-33]|uniref:pyocin knob domain-containing protein n=1 Tax=Agathobaculum sp. NTUH-O15-33 TaxID=3079302 RepID=UPI002958BC93|nr:pyocin knob domain-containing protein [Agathobaculum sp. NTUH-O15-33]WNX85798.1 pyocin knob domain-containing protein [Agathobaculum sp. NTUH-O15-33]
MSVLSKVLSLFKYDPVADKAKTFNIKQALNDNWGEIERSVSELDTAIEAETTRATGQANTVQGNLQKHIIDAVVHMSQAERDGLAAKLAEMSAAISANSSSLANKVEKVTVLPSGTDLNTVIESGIYRLNGNGETFTNGIGSDCGWGIMVVGSYIDTTFQELYTLANRSFTRMRASDVNWSSWARLATATPPQEYALPLAAGIVNIPDYTSTYSKDQFGRVMINLYLDRADGSAFTTWHEMLAILPEGYRPAKDANAIGSATSSTTSGPVGLAVNHDGALRVYPYTHTETRVSCTFIFQAS